MTEFDYCGKCENCESDKNGIFCMIMGEKPLTKDGKCKWFEESEMEKRRKIELKKVFNTKDR